jgi:hypothetical protein
MALDEFIKSTMIGGLVVVFAIRSRSDCDAQGSRDGRAASDPAHLDRSCRGGAD